MNGAEIVGYCGTCPPFSPGERCGRCREMIIRFDAALAEVQRERDLLTVKLRVTTRVLHGHKEALEAAEQREREAGAAMNALREALEKLAADWMEWGSRPVTSSNVCYEDEMLASVRHAEEISAALAAVRSGPAQPPNAAHACQLDSTALRHDAPAPVSDPPKAKGDEACLRGSDGCQIKGRHSMCGTVVADPAKDPAKVASSPVADPTETER